MPQRHHRLDRRGNIVLKHRIRGYLVSVPAGFVLLPSDIKPLQHKLRHPRPTIRHQPVRSDTNAGPDTVCQRGAHAAEEFWDPIRAREGRCVLAPGRFYLCASRERLRVPPSLAAEMLPVDLGLGELRNNYAGFFDSGFGWEAERPAPGALPGTPAVLEVRAHDVPFEIEDGQVLFRLRYFRTSGPPRSLYGRGRRGPSYRGQDLTLARVFRAPAVARP